MLFVTLVPVLVGQIASSMHDKATAGAKTTAAHCTGRHEQRRIVTPRSRRPHRPQTRSVVCK